MKSLNHLLSFTALVFSGFFAEAQSTVRDGIFRHIKDDSVIISYNRNYFMMEDSCADIVRFCHYDFERRTFKGKFKDVSRMSPKQTIAIGSYDENGLKQGSFMSYHLNGSVQARGSFKNDVFDGKWEFFYESGSPKLIFVAAADGVQILNVWSEDGKKTIDNGYGDYVSVIGALTWKGKLIGGKPDGKWILQRSFHSEALVTERFKLGEFQKGTNQVGEYKDSSRIVLVSSDLLPLTKAEKFFTSNEACNVPKKKNITIAWYSGGREKFAEEIKDRLAPILGGLHLNPFNEPIELHGKIMEDGAVVFDDAKGDSKVTAALISGLHSLPHFEPARIEGKAAKQAIVIAITYNYSVYSFSYRLLPVATD